MFERPQNRHLKRGGPGRPKGAVGKIKREVAALAKSLVEDAEYQRSLKARLIAGKAAQLEPILFYYAYGKPKERVELSGAVAHTHTYRERFTAMMDNPELREAALRVAHALTGVGAGANGHANGHDPGNNGAGA